MNESILVSIIGVGGVIVGSFATIAGNVVLYCLKNRAAKASEEPQRKLLLEMLKDHNYNWRKIETLMHVIGADEKTTKRLLLEVGARASEDGQALWGLKTRNPLPLCQ